MSNKVFLALHIGAGYHSEVKEPQYKQLCKKACSLGLDLLLKGNNASYVAELVCSFLEDSPLTNAGYGSNLNIKGQVECDAAIMESLNGAFSGIACVQSVKNPIKLARMLLEGQKTTNDILILPLMLVGEGAETKAKEFALKMVDNKELISKKSLAEYNHYKSMVENAAGDHEIKIKKTAEEQSVHRNLSQTTSQQSSSYHTTSQAVHQLPSSPNSKRDLDVKEDGNSKRHCYNKEKIESNFQDTVGVICVDGKGCVTTCVSSGGIVLKQPGRVGHAPHFGCGCWAFDYNPTISIACCTSGNGEQLIRTNLARNISNHFTTTHNDKLVNLSEILEEDFLQSPILQCSKHPKYCGVLLLKLERNEVDSKTELYADLNIAHTSPSFCFGFITNGYEKCKPQVYMSRLKDEYVGNKAVSQEYSFQL